MKNMIEKMKKRTLYVLDNERGDIPVGTIAVIAVAMIIGGLLFGFKEQVKGLMEAVGNKIQGWTNDIGK